MTKIGWKPVLAVIAAAPMLAFGVPALAQASAAMLAKLDRGSWEVRFREDGTARRICVRNGTELVQLRHEGNCNRFVVDQSTNHLTVQYTCRGNGYGRTTLRQETPSLVQITSEGIERGRPFSLSAEARRVGSCS